MAPRRSVRVAHASVPSEPYNATLPEHGLKGSASIKRGRGRSKNSDVGTLGSDHDAANSSKRGRARPRKAQVVPGPRGVRGYRRRDGRLNADPIGSEVTTYVA